MPSILVGIRMVWKLKSYGSTGCGRSSLAGAGGFFCVLVENGVLLGYIEAGIRLKD